MNNGYENLDTGEGESTTDEEESTTSQELSEEDTTSGTPSQDTEESKPTETLQVHTICNKSTHDEDDSYQDENMIEIEPYKVNGEKKEDKLLATNFQVEMEN